MIAVSLHQQELFAHAKAHLTGKSCMPLSLSGIRMVLCLVPLSEPRLTECRRENRREFPRIHFYRLNDPSQPIELPCGFDGFHSARSFFHEDVNPWNLISKLCRISCTGSGGDRRRRAWVSAQCKRALYREQSRDG